MKNSLTLFIYLLVAGLLCIGCGDSNQKKGMDKDKLRNTQPGSTQTSNLPSITFDEMKVIYEGADFIDIIFYNVEFSMSVNNKSNIQRIVGFVSTNMANVNPACQPMGRIFFQKEGEMLMEADMYYDDVCRYFVFYKDGKPTYANNITPEGQGYFGKIFSQVKVEPLPQGQ